jgi:hypothetical protein
MLLLCIRVTIDHYWRQLLSKHTDKSVDVQDPRQWKAKRSIHGLLANSVLRGIALTIQLPWQRAIPLKTICVLRVTLTAGMLSLFVAYETD